MTFASSATGRTGLGHWWSPASPLAEPGRTLLGITLNPNQFPDDLMDSATSSAVGALSLFVRQQDLSSARPVISTRIDVVGNGNIDVGNDSPTRKTGKPMVEQMKAAGSSDAGTKRQMQAGQPHDCGAMSQQGSFSYHGNVSSPQQLVHLVGCRDPKVRGEPWTRPAPQRR